MKNFTSGTKKSRGEDFDIGVMNALGEVLWHAGTLDDSIVQVSHEHRSEVEKFAKSYLTGFENKSVRFLEVASYAHITGYLLAKQYGWDITLSDISAHTLALGARHAQQNGLDSDLVRRVAIDFHDLPFPDGAFDIVYIASALHHTLNWQTVLKEMQRVIAPSGLLILQNEPCLRHFCFYKFPTNRSDAYRPIETELQQQGILKTIAEPYPGSRPEALFGMVENQKIPLYEILQILEDEGTIENLSIDSSICMSKFDNTILSDQRDVESVAKRIGSELSDRLSKVCKLLTPTDTAMGYCLPTTADVAIMAQSLARRLELLPDPDSQKYTIAVADLFGGSITAVMRKSSTAIAASQPDLLRYDNSERNGVIIAYPPTLTKILDLAHDLVPDIQVADPSEISQCFPHSEWLLDSNANLRYLVLRTLKGSIRLREPTDEHRRFVVLFRVYGAPTDTPFRIQLLANSAEIAGVDVYQADSFLLRGEIPSSHDTDLFLRVCTLNLETLTEVPPVTVAAIRVVCVSIP